jgi:hypothetical protein
MRSSRCGTRCRSITRRITPELDPRTPKRELTDAWRVRRSKYARWLEDPETFFVIAEDEGGPVDDMAITTTRACLSARVCDWRAPDQAEQGRREAE